MEVGFYHRPYRMQRAKDLAYRVKGELDVRSFAFDISSANKYYGKFLREKIENPTIADVAMREVDIKRSVNYPFDYDQNFYQLKNDPEIKCLNETLSKTMEKMYPKTANLRHKLVMNDRINSYETLPKLTGFKKKLLKLKIFI